MCRQVGNSVRVALLLVPLAAALPRPPAHDLGAAEAPAARAAAAATAADATRLAWVNGVAADDTSVTSVLTAIGHAVKNQLNAPHVQWFNASLALVVGIALLVDGDFVFKWVLVGAGFLFAMMLARNEISALWGLGHESSISYVVGVEAGLCAAYGVSRGMEGVMIMVGAGLGVVIAHSLQNFFLHAGYSDFHSNRWLIVVLYTLFIFLCVWVMGARKRYMWLLTFLAPLLGGALVSSVVSWLTVVFKTGMASTIPWVDFLLALCSNEHKDVGIFAGSGKQVVIVWETLSLDRLCGLIFWFLLFAGGAAYQFLKLRRLKENRVNDSAALSGLRAPILRDSV